MADSEAPGEAKVDEPDEDRIDTDPFAVQTADAADSPPVDDEFEYLPGTPPAAAADPAPDGHGFDAFNANTWTFKAPPPPWYRMKKSVLTMVAVVIAVVTLVVSIVLLATRSPTDDERSPATETSAVPTTATTPATTRAVAPAPLPPPPPPPPPPSEAQRAPVYAPAPRQTKKPEINVTRKPMSVSPQKPSNRR